MQKKALQTIEVDIKDLLILEKILEDIQNAKCHVLVDELAGEALDLLEDMRYS